jgi:uncharacterized membrane protein
MKITLTKTDKTLLICSLLCLLLISTRIVYTERITYIFLIWNLFLAGLPYLVSRLLEIKTKKTKLNIIRAIIFWLPFFPNSPYILTDFVHLTYNTSNLFWVDVSLLSIFSLTGLMFGIYSLRIMVLIIKKETNYKTSQLFFYSTIFLAGFGIYIGRVLRWNSWDIVSNPTKLIGDLANIMFNPIDNYQIWVVSLGFSLMILIASFLLKPISN